jgi:hypothetical protein
MRPYAIRLLTLAICVCICATAVVVIPMTAASEGAAASRHLRKPHQRTNPGWTNSLRRSSAGELQPSAPTFRARGNVCPGNARAIDCSVWPPPYDDDPDRKATSSDGG